MRKLGNLIHRPDEPDGVWTAHFVSVVAFQPRSPAGQAGRGFARDLCSQSPGRCPRCTTHVKDPSGLVPLVNKVGWLREAGAKTTDPHVLVTWVKKIGGHAQAGESHSPSGQAGRGLDVHSVSVVAFQPRSPAGQAGRGSARDLCSQSPGRCPWLGEPRPVGAGMGCTTEQNRNVTTTSTRSNSAQASPTLAPTSRKLG